jgi:hypothetical protein
LAFQRSMGGVKTTTDVLFVLGSASVEGLYSMVGCLSEKVCFDLQYTPIHWLLARLSRTDHKPASDRLVINVVRIAQPSLKLYFLWLQLGNVVLDFYWTSLVKGLIPRPLARKGKTAFGIQNTGARDYSTL